MGRAQLQTSTYGGSKPPRNFPGENEWNIPQIWIYLGMHIWPVNNHQGWLVLSSGDILIDDIKNKWGRT